MSTVLPRNMAKNNKKRAAVSQAPEADSSKPGDKPTVSDSALTLTEHAIRAETNEAAKNKSKKGKAAKNAQEPTAKTDADATVAAGRNSDHVSPKQTACAIAELQKYLERTKKEKPQNGKSDLFADADDAHEQHDDRTNIYLKFEFKKYYSDRAVLKPRLIPLTHPYLPQHKQLRTCLFVRDNLIKTENELEELEAAKVPTLAKVLTLAQLKSIYKPYDKRYELLDEYDVFVTDDAIMPSLPSTLGKPFYHETPKSPIAIALTLPRERQLSVPTLQSLLEMALGATTYLPPVGTALSVRVGSLDRKFTTEKVLANIADVLREFPAEKLVTVGLATADLPVLPLFYTDKLYGDEDVLEAVEVSAEPESEVDVLKGALLELGDEEAVDEVIGKKHKKRKVAAA